MVRAGGVACPSWDRGGSGLAIALSYLTVSVSGVCLSSSSRCLGPSSKTSSLSRDNRYIRKTRANPCAVDRNATCRLSLEYFVSLTLVWFKVIVYIVSSNVE